MQTEEALLLDFIEWLVRKERSYEETMNAWRTSCPRLTIWEDANEQHLVSVQHNNGVSVVSVTAAGLEHLNRFRPPRLISFCPYTNTFRLGSHVVG
jgi:hypothetical protein